MRIAGIDLNLLTSLDALLEEKNVTRAARRLGVSQPAASHALRRLRELLGDPLLVRTTTGMTATPRALELRGMVRTAIDAAEAVLRPAPSFDPATAQRTFSVVMVDQAAYQLLPTLVERLAREAPGIRLDVRPSPAGRFVDVLADDLDLTIGVFLDAPAGVRDEPLWHEEFVCVIRRGCAAARGPFDLDRLVSLPHLLVSPRGLPGSALESALARHGRTRRVGLTVPHFLVAPHVVASTELVWTAPRGLARAFADQVPLAIRDPPIPLAGFTLTMRWHQRLDGDPGLAWLRSMFHEVAPA